MKFEDQLEWIKIRDENNPDVDESYLRGYDYLEWIDLRNKNNPWDISFWRVVYKNNPLG